MKQENTNKIEDYLNKVYGKSLLSVDIWDENTIVQLSLKIKCYAQYFEPVRFRGIEPKKDLLTITYNTQDLLTIIKNKETLTEIEGKKIFKQEEKGGINKNE